jgi:similar to stage IV sporulation protein
LYYKSIKKCKDDSIKIKVSSSQVKNFTILFDKNNIKYRVIYDSRYLFLNKLKKRAGIIIGFFIMAVILNFSSNIVWRIDIEGNNNLSDKEILKILENSNFRIGSYIPKIDYDEIQNKILLNTNKLSWISLNINGNVACVEVKETLAQDKSEKNQYTNIIASDSGQIVEMKIFNGEKIVALKDVVKEGDLLISGISTSQSQGVKYTNASGEVYAIVNKDIKICIPYENEKKTYIGKVYTKKRLKIFSKEINFYINNNKYVEICDKIEKEKQILLFGKYKLPIIIYETRYYPYQIDKAVYSKSEAVDVAMAKLRHDLDDILMNAELVSKSIKTSNNDTSILVNCNIYIIKNIAREAEFIIEE